MIIDLDEDDSLLKDEDTVTSVASEATLCRGGAGWDADCEEHKFGPSPATNPGPPFKVGDIVLCDIPGKLWGVDPKINCLQRGFIMQADDPNYKIRLEQGATVWTNRSEFWLQLHWAMGLGTQFAEDVDNPFADLRDDPSMRFGSYGVHINAQCDALKKVAEAKEFAKAVKADDAAVPKHLWNDRIRWPGHGSAARRGTGGVLETGTYVVPDGAGARLCGLHLLDIRNQLAEGPSYKGWGDDHPGERQGGHCRYSVAFS